ncbi:MAG: hypothetical protein ACFB50_13355 [Rubrobacteraceae bacterium]
MPGNNEAQNPSRGRDENQGERQGPQSNQQRPPQPAREPSQTTEPVGDSSGGRGKVTEVQGPTQSAGAAQISVQNTQQPQAKPQAEPAPERDAQPTTETASVQQGNQAAQPVDTATQGYAESAVEPGWNQTAPQATDTLQEQGIADTGVAVQEYAPQDVGTQVSEVPVGVEQADASWNVAAPENNTDPYVEDVAVEVAPATDPATYGAEVDPTPYDAPAVPTETYEAAAPADAYTETYTEPVARVPAQELEPVQQVATQELETAPQVDNALSGEPAAAQPGEAPTGTEAGVVSPTPESAAQQEVSSTVDATIQQTMGAGGGE